MLNFVNRLHFVFPHFVFVNKFVDDNPPIEQLILHYSIGNVVNNTHWPYYLIKIHIGLTLFLMYTMGII